MPETRFGWPVLFGSFGIHDIRNIATDLAERGDKWSQTNDKLAHTDFLARRRNPSRRQGRPGAVPLTELRPPRDHPGCFLAFTADGE